MDNYQKSKMLKIGDVAKLNQVSIDTLRYYDKIGLFTADWVDDNGYRYYWPENMVNLDLIMWLRMDGVGLEQIREMLNDQSLEHVQAMLVEREKEMVGQIKKLRQQLQFYRMYSGYMQLAQEYQDNTAYFLSFSKRWYVQTKGPVAMKDKNAYEMGLKTLFEQFTDKFYYYNSFFGGVFHGNGEAGYETQLYPAVYPVAHLEYVNDLPMEEGIYAILPVRGYFDRAYEKIPELLEFIRKNQYHTCSDFYVMKIWERSGRHEEKIEIMELQVRVEKD